MFHVIVTVLVLISTICNATIEENGSCAEEKTIPNGGRIEVTETAYHNRFSYVVSLYDEEHNYVCVGSVLTSRLILTTSTCVQPKPPVTHVRVNTRDSYDGGEIHYVKEAIMYDQENYTKNDIALLLLKTKILDVHPVQLVSPSDVQVSKGDQVLALGWGKMDNNVWPQYLMGVYLEVSPDEKCQKFYSGGDSWICTENKITYICAGSAGAPILFGDKQVGVVSHGDIDKRGMTCSSNQPVASVNLLKYLDWIQTYTQNKTYA
ncbi:hypothetical protein QAD02_018709 [Eretmocerus hayati]|uniref:Uncharacterized protein n=1 Tax=Eretmocerus hayati TaxID=131215 RepID=A0ACC2PKI4_9HYME|nr:hypothetical protein QAD02_018709 [Eretmocerus hayati]